MFWFTCGDVVTNLPKDKVVLKQALVVVFNSFVQLKWHMFNCLVKRFMNVIRMPNVPLHDYRRGSVL